MNSRMKPAIIGLVLLAAVAVAAWEFSGTYLAKTVQQSLLQTANSSVNGSLTVGEVEFSLGGGVVAKQVELKDKAGKLVASSKSLTIELDLSDLLSRRVDITRIRKIKLDGLRLQLNRDSEKHWNVMDVLHKTSDKDSAASTAAESAFRGQVTATNSTISIVTENSQYEFKEVNASLDFAKYPDIAMNLESKNNPSHISANGIWNFSSGGSITVNSNGVEPAALLSNSPLKGTMTAAFVLSGTTKKPAAKGSFKIPSGSLGDSVFTDASGDFTFSESTLTLSNTNMNALGGTITANGPMNLDTLIYSQSVTGQNVDSAQLAEEDIHGRLQFSAEVEGQRNWDSARADGTFQMGSGSISGIAFDALTGNFSKRGKAVRYYNIKVSIAGQTFTIGDADSLSALKTLSKNIILPGIAAPAIPKVPTAPALPKLPGLPKLF